MRERLARVYSDVHTPAISVNAGRNPHFFAGMWMGADDLRR
jgi:hypothetical protein